MIHQIASDPIDRGSDVRRTRSGRNFMAFEASCSKRFERPLTCVVSDSGTLQHIDIDDVAQRTLIAAFSLNLTSINRIATFAAWLFTIARYQLRVGN